MGNAMNPEPTADAQVTESIDRLSHDINRFTRWATDIHRNGFREDSPYITRNGASGGDTRHDFELQGRVLVENIRGVVDVINTLHGPERWV